MAEEINEERVVVLIDMNGWTDGGRSDVFALRPAPLSLHGKGFPASSGSRLFLDGALADRVAMPADYAGDWTERLLYLAPSWSYHLNARRAAFKRDSDRKRLLFDRYGRHISSSHSSMLFRDGR